MKHFLLTVIVMVAGVSAQAATVPGHPTDLSTKFYIENGQGVIKGQFKAPTVDNSWEEKPLTDLIMLDVTRSCWMLDERDIPVAHFDNAVPGKTYTFIDNNLSTYGYYYTYTVTASNTKGESGWGSSSSESAYAGIVVAKPEFVNITTAEKGSSPITFTMRGEALDEEGNELGYPLTALVLTYSADDDDETSGTVGIIENPESGKEYQLQFEGINGMSYEFYLAAEFEFGRSETATRSIFIGADTPAAPGEVKAVPFEDGAKITWSAPVDGRYHGWIDPAEIRYKIERVINNTTRILLAENIEECEYFDPCEDLTTLTSLKYAVTAYNSLGNGGSASSENITVGPSAKLPFIEHFNTPFGYGVTADNIWTEVPEAYNWSYSSSSYSSGGLKGVLAEDKVDEGYAYCSGYADAENRLVSTPINMTSAKYPVLSFWYGSRPDAANLLAVGVSIDGEEKIADEFCIADEYTDNAIEDDMPVWLRRIVAIPEAAGNNASIVFNAQCVKGSNNETLCIDEVLLDDYPPVEIFMTNFKDGAGTVSWIAPANSTGEPTRYEVLMDNEPCADITSAELIMNGVEDRDYTVKVRAWYEDIPSCWSDSFVFNPLTTGILTIGSDGSRTEYYDLTGTRRISFNQGEILIRRSVSTDGKVSISKVRM